MLAGWAAACAVVVLCASLLQQVPVYNPAPDVRRTPLAREAAFAMLAGIAALIALALRFALKPDRDPFELRPARRTKPSAVRSSICLRQWSNKLRHCFGRVSTAALLTI